ncbi:unnamed protein product [Schistosoma margrebowiei]|uniref:26S proteasome regulatory subunit RPN3 n=1 Tax=Schistosoma margrebowiei TaxID=48269 RepID=A0A183MI31_9TREM|nr:unnamed protein product [Schistosoma margrebowiei]
MKSGTQQLPENDMGPLAASDKLMDGSPSENLKDADELLLEDIRDQIRYIEKSVMTKEIYYMTRVVRGLSGVRRRLNCNVLRGLMQGYFPNPSPQKTYFLEFLPEACKCSNLLMDRLSATGRRSMALLASRCYYYHSRSYELVGRLDSVRSFFHARLSTATLRSNFDTKAVLINLLLRNYLHYQLHEQAHKLVSRVVFPESAPNNEWARYLYYLGRIKAIQLDYSSAHEHLVSALRKAPQHTAIGFKQTLHKLNTVVELLLGEQPDRSIFRQTTFKAALQPYFQLTQAIHAGDLSRFNDTLRVHGAQFSADKMYTLIIRLRHNVIKTGVRRISLSYSRISLVDIAKKLQLDSVEDAEYIVAKAIRDGVIDAIINHKEGHVTTNETLDLYSTREPFNQFHQRIKFCLSIHNQAERREREQQELENAKELSEDEFDGFP